MRGIWIADKFLFVACNALRRAVAPFAVRWRVDLFQDAVIDIALESLIDREQIPLQAVRSDLDAIREALFDVINQSLSRIPITLADGPRQNQFRVGIHCNPSPDIASVWVLCL